MDLTMWLWIALAIVVVGLIIAGIGAVIFMSGMKEPMKDMQGSANSLKERMDKLNLEASSLQHTTTELQEGIAVKSEKISVLTNGVKGTKNALIDLNSSVRAVTDRIALRTERDKRNVDQVNQWSNTAVSVLKIPQNLQTTSDGNSPENQEALPYEETR